jgi:galactokinase
VDYVLRKAGYRLTQGINAVLLGNIPGGGMSRSASLALNLILSALDANGIVEKDQMKIVDLAQLVENEYIGSPCGKLDQIMILFAKAGMGTHYIPATRSIKYVKLGKKARDFRIVVMDTGTVRPGLEKSTYKIRRAECEEMAQKAKDAGFGINCLADIKDDALYEKIKTQFKKDFPHLVDRMTYIFKAQARFYKMMSAWKKGDIATVGKIFRLDGIGLRDEYKISGPELETMCDIVRTVPQVLGERMLGGGDKGAAGALVLSGGANALKKAVETAYPRSRPDFADKFAVHTCKVVDGVKVFEKGL